MIIHHDNHCIASLHPCLDADLLEELAKDASLELCESISTMHERDRDACLELAETIASDIEFLANQRRIHHEARRAMLDVINMPFTKKKAG